MIYSYIVLKISQTRISLKNIYYILAAFYFLWPIADDYLSRFAILLLLTYKTFYISISTRRVYQVKFARANSLTICQTSLLLKRIFFFGFAI